MTPLKEYRRMLATVQDEYEKAGIEPRTSVLIRSLEAKVEKVGSEYENGYALQSEFSDALHALKAAWMAELERRQNLERLG